MFARRFNLRQLPISVGSSLGIGSELLDEALKVREFLCRILLCVDLLQSLIGGGTRGNDNRRYLRVRRGAEHSKSNGERNQQTKKRAHSSSVHEGGLCGESYNRFSAQAS